jgi:hypothetical protein
MTDYEYDWIPESIEEIRKDHKNTLYGYVDRAVSRKTGFLKRRKGRVIDQANGGFVYYALW